MRGVELSHESYLASVMPNRRHLDTVLTRGNSPEVPARMSGTDGAKADIVPMRTVRHSNRETLSDNTLTDSGRTDLSSELTAYTRRVAQTCVAAPVAQRLVNRETFGQVWIRFH
jgi:hypothetical protein